MDQRFKPAIQKVTSLQKHNRYEAALIFGSLARGGANENSDVDCIVITKEDTDKSILHPYIAGIKLDISYSSYTQLEDEFNKTTNKSGREPMIAGCIIVFDKTGRLTELMKRINRVRPMRWTKAMEAEQRFNMYHANNKVVRNLEQDKIAATYSMNMGIDELLKVHYLINRRWWLSNKKLFDDLKSWDKKMYELLKAFLVASTVDEKYKYWDKIYKYVHGQIGGIKPLDDSIPREFKKDIQLLTE